MTTSETWAWTEEAFLCAWEAGVFGDQRVELVEGEVWPVSPIHAWHGEVSANVVRLLHRDGWRVTMATLPSVGSLPDPGAWVRRRDAQPVGTVGHTGRMSRWDPADVALVVEVSDSSYARDTSIKARVYGRAGYAEYWVVHRGGVEVFTEPGEAGYWRRESHPPEAAIGLPHADDSVAVADLLDTDAG